MAKTVIEQLKSIQGLKLECPNCAEAFPVRRAQLFGMHDAYPPKAQKVISDRLRAAKEEEDELRQRRKALAVERKRTPERIAVTAEATNLGQISEHIMPALAAFPYVRSECRSLFRPVDYVMFGGLVSKGAVESITFIEVKSGGGQLTREQRSVRDAVADGKVSHRVIK